MGQEESPAVLDIKVVVAVVWGKPADLEKQD